MVFNSLEYLLFLPTVFILYWFLCKSILSRNLLIVAASYLFYGWWSWKFLILIFITTICSFATGILIERESNKRKRRYILAFNVIINIGILFIYKYYDFFALSFAQILSIFGMTADSVTLDLILPVGISFYTFQAVSYTIDVYRKELKATANAPAFFSFISFFPQLVAGPIERATNLLPQFQNNRNFDYSEAVDGMKLILWGLFKKVMIADYCAKIVNLTFSNYAELGSLNLWWGAVAFTFQIYGDFSGYSDIAIGSASLFGINLKRNFNIPYFATDIPDFWKRWHISLQTWFRDYIYIPLGGSRNGKAKTARNTAVVFLISGLWHGANWTYIVWGLYHAVLFLPKTIFGKKKETSTNSSGTRSLKPFRKSTYMALTFMLVLIGWVIFRSETLMDAAHYLHRMFINWDYTGTFQWYTAILIAMLLFAEYVSKGKPTPFNFPEKGFFSHRATRWTIYIISITAIITLSGSKTDFIYFQF